MQILAVLIYHEKEDGEVPGLVMDFQLEAVAEERLEHVGALTVGEILQVWNLSRIEFCLDVELSGINPRRASDDEFAVENSVCQLDQLAKRDDVTPADSVLATPGYFASPPIAMTK